MEKLQGKTLFSKFDIHHGYNNIQLAKEDRHKAAMQSDFAPFLEQYRENAGQYMDDWWIAMVDDVERRALHVEAIHAFLSTCKEKSYFLKASKCEIMRSQITLLGWLVTGEGLRIDPSKVMGISEWLRTLTSVRQVQNISKNQHFLFHLIQSYYILFLLFWG